MSERKCKSVCIFSPKGGVGKTILAMNLAGISSLINKKVLLIDFDLFNGCISMLIDKNISKTIFDLVDDFNNNKFQSFSDYIYKYNENIDILCAPKDPRQGNKIESKYIKIILDKVKNTYDLVIIDTSSVLDEITLTILDVVNLILFVVTNDLFHIKNLRNIINLFKENEIDNFKVLINNSIDFKSQYFSLSDIKKILGTNINYSISNSFFMKDITSYLYENTIPVLVKGNDKKHNSEINNLNNIIKDILKEDNNEKE